MRPLIALIALVAPLLHACDPDPCTTDDDCFSGEVCVKAAGASSGACDKPKGADMAAPVDMPSPADMGNDLDMTTPTDMAPDTPDEEMGEPGDMAAELVDLPDLPSGGTLVDCIRAGCQEGGGTCVSRGRMIGCEQPAEVSSCAASRVLVALDATAPVRGVALSKAADERLLIVAGRDATRPDVLRMFHLDSRDLEFQRSSYQTHALAGPATIHALARHDISGQRERIVAATSYDVRAPQLSLLWFGPAGASDAGPVELLAGWESERVDQMLCGADALPAINRRLCPGAPVQLKTAPEQADGQAPDLVISACWAGETQDVPALMQVRPGEASLMDQTPAFSAPVSTCGQRPEALSITELDANLSGGDQSSGHVWTLAAASERLGLTRYDWRGSDVVGVIADQLAFIQNKDLSNPLVLTPVRAACNMSAGARWDLTRPGLLLGSTADRDEAIYLGAMGDRAAVLRYHTGNDGARVACPTTLRGLRWIDAAQRPDGDWIAVGVRSNDSALMVVQGQRRQGAADLLTLSAIRGTSELEPLGVYAHPDRSTSLLVRAGQRVSHLYLSPAGAPECP